MSGRVHIYTAPLQPYTRYVDPFIGGRPIRNPPRKIGYCYACGRQRWAKNLRIQIFYDASYVYCAEPDAHTVERVPFSIWSKRRERIRQGTQRKSR